MSRLLINPQCHDALTTEGLDAFETFENTEYRATDLGSPNAGANTINSSTVFINSAGAFFTAVPDPAGHVTFTIPSTTANGPATSITFLSQASANAFLLLHELGHQTGMFGPDAGEDKKPINAQNSWVVLSNCFGIGEPGH